MNPHSSATVGFRRRPHVALAVASEARAVRARRARALTLRNVPYGRSFILGFFRDGANRIL